MEITMTGAQTLVTNLGTLLNDLWQSIINLLIAATTGQTIINIVLVLITYGIIYVGLNYLATGNLNIGAFKKSVIRK